MTAAKKTANVAGEGKGPGDDGQMDPADEELARQLAERARVEGLALDTYGSG